jgi:uncharacterized protein with GYD domain
MPRYITLYKLTQKGIQDIKNSPQRIRDGIAAWEKMGGKLVGFYSTQGPYDYVGISETDNEETAAAFLLGLGSQGYVTTTTMRAWDPGEFAKIVDKIP